MYIHMIVYSETSPIADTLGTTWSVLIKEMSLFQR